MRRFAIKTLEFDKVKDILSEKTATFLGSQAAASLRIESNIAVVKRMHEETGEASFLLNEGKRFPFGGAYDITVDVKRAEIGGILEAAVLLKIMTTAIAIRQMRTFLVDENRCPVLSAIPLSLDIFPRLEKQIGNVVDDHGEIKDSASLKLNGLRSAIQIAKNRVRERLNSILHNTENQKYFQDTLVTMRGDRYVIPVKQEYRMNFPGLVHDQSGSWATLFIELMEIVNLNNDIKRYQSEEK